MADVKLGNEEPVALIVKPYVGGCIINHNRTILLVFCLNDGDRTQEGSAAVD